MLSITPESREFLLKDTRTGKLATVQANGHPHVAPIWFVLDGDTLVFSTGENTVKGKDLRRTGLASLCVDDEIAPYSFAMIEGTVTLSTKPDELKYWATKIAERYMGKDRAEAVGASNAAPGALLVRMTPTKVVFVRDLAS
jgi:PPOX class probable F420-dependent enzyme